MSSGRSAFAADDVVGGYQLIRRAGKGGMAEVWLARKATGRGRAVAFKVILPHLAGEPRYSRMFRMEAEVSGLMSHSNIVQVFDEGEDGGISFLVMEWIEGINLVRLREALKLIDNADVRASMVAFVIGQLLHALSYAHQLTDPSGAPLGIVHRDVSPQNVLVSTSGDVKLLDFGVAHTVIEESSGLHVKGKLRYMAPEQLTSRTKAPTLDLFGVGALLHELLDGRRFRGDFKDDRQLHAQVMRGLAPSLRAPVAPELERLRQSLLAADPAARPQSAAAALDMLGQFRGYRDCRVELSQVVGSLMGSTRPRSAVEPSSASSMAPSPTSTPPPSVAAPSPAMPAPLASAPVQQAPHAHHAHQPQAPPERTMFIDGGGLPPGALAPDSRSVLPSPGPAAALPIQEPTAFLPNPQHGSGPGVAASPSFEPEEGTAFIAPPQQHGAPHRAAPPSGFAQPHARAYAPMAPQVMAPNPGVVRPHEPNEPSMTRFVVHERSAVKTVLMFVAGLMLALSAAGAAAYFILQTDDTNETSE